MELVFSRNTLDLEKGSTAIRNNERGEKQEELTDI
jgi:hypothetical protein